MGFLPVLAVGFLMHIVAVLFAVCAVVLVLVILLQKGRGGGLSGVLGGGVASGILGSKTGDFLTWVTIVLVSLFLTLAVVMAKYYRPGTTKFGQGQDSTTPVQQPPEQPSRPDTGADNSESGLGGAQGGADANSFD